VSYRGAFTDEDVEKVKQAVAQAKNEKLVQTFKQIEERISISNKTYKSIVNSALNTTEYWTASLNN